MRFAWDSRTARANSRKHGVSFEEAAECFADPLALILVDVAHDDRLILIGESPRRRLMFVVYVEILEKDDLVRIVSARKATLAERRRYEEADET